MDSSTSNSNSSKGVGVGKESNSDQTEDNGSLNDAESGESEMDMQEPGKRDGIDENRRILTWIPPFPKNATEYSNCLKICSNKSRGDFISFIKHYNVNKAQLGLDEAQTAILKTLRDLWVQWKGKDYDYFVKISKLNQFVNSSQSKRLQSLKDTDAIWRTYFNDMLGWLIHVGISQSQLEAGLLGKSDMIFHAFK